MTLRTGKIVLLAAAFAVAMSVPGLAQFPCGAPNQIYCQPWDGGWNIYASQNDTTLGNYATVYDNFTLTETWDVESFHWVGGYFDIFNQGPIAAWTLTFYNDNAGSPGNPIASQVFPGNGSETFIANVSGFPVYAYEVYWQSFDMAPSTYWASVVPDLDFPSHWGWSTGTAEDGVGWQCFFGTCETLPFDFAFAIDGRVVNPTPEPGSLILLGTGLLGLAGAIRRKLP